jgi:hypothetical protein
MSKISTMTDYGYILTADDELGCAITWNGHLTFLFWIEKQTGWENTDVMTLSEDPIHVSRAEKIAIEWLNEIVNEDYEGED